MEHSNRGSVPWIRVSRAQRCPVCDRADWCSISDNGDLVVCMRVAEGARRPTRNGGWLHVIGDGDARPKYRSASISGRAARSHSDGFAVIARSTVRALTEARIKFLESDLRLPYSALVPFTVGWSAQHDAFTFPMRDESGNVTGIRLRARNGRKWAVQGSRQGLFIPEGLLAAAPREQVSVCEGATDTASLLHLGFAVIGRPSCVGAVELVRRTVTRLGAQSVTILADRDGPGVRGANSLAATLAARIPRVTIATPPEGVNDAREWITGGATRADVDAVLSDAPRFRFALGNETGVPS